VEKEPTVKRIQCTNCGQAFWTELKGIDEGVIRSGEWVQHPCPKCRAEWAIFEPGIIRARVVRKGRAKRGPKCRVLRRKPALPAGEKPLLTPARIRSIRRKLGITQKDLAALIKVSTGAVVNWEKGKFKPKKDKISQLTGLMKLGKGDVKNLLAEKMPKQTTEEKKPEQSPPGKPKLKKKTRTRRKTAPSPEENKS
jgi:transcriptional regulator with XRE-family HTH domain